MKIPALFRTLFVPAFVVALSFGWNPGLRAAGPDVPPTAAPAMTPGTPAQEAESPGEFAAYLQWRAQQPPEAIPWIEVLEKNLGDFYLRRFEKAKAKGIEDAWDYVKDDPSLPRVLLIGDSISRGYTVAVRHDLAGKANLHRAPANCGPTAYGLKSLDIWLGDTKWDVIHFNFGIHDHATAPEVYKANLEQIVARLRKTNAHLIWATTTPAPLQSKNPKEMTAAQCDQLNAVANGVMKEQGIPIDDLYAWVLPQQAELQNPDDVHFHNAGYEFMAQKVSQSIMESLSTPAPPPAAPSP